MKKLILLLIAFAITSQHVAAQFKDQGFVTARVRTDYNSQTEGQSSNPITYVSPCLFPAEACGNGPTVFSATNSFSQNVTGYPTSNFWVLDFNNEISYYRGNQTTFNPGPPNQSIARSAPGYGVMGFTAITNPPGENYYRAHLVANGTFPNPNTDGRPYIAIGGERNRGNDGIGVGTLNQSGGYKRVQFKAKLWDMINPTKLPTTPERPVTSEPSIAFYVTAKTTWGGKARGVQLTLYHWGIENSKIPPDPPAFAAQEKWNWPMQESFYHPGVEWAFIDAEDVQYFCPSLSVLRLTTKGQQISYNINLESLFQCLSNNNAWDTPMPGSILTISGVHWAVEMSGVNGALWTSVHDMKMAQ